MSNTHEYGTFITRYLAPLLFVLVLAGGWYAFTWIVNQEKRCWIMEKNDPNEPEYYNYSKPGCNGFGDRPGPALKPHPGVRLGLPHR